MWKITLTTRNQTPLKIFYWHVMALCRISFQTGEENKENHCEPILLGILPRCEEYPTEARVDDP